MSLTLNEFLVKYYYIPVGQKIFNFLILSLFPASRAKKNPFPLCDFGTVGKMLQVLINRLKAVLVEALFTCVSIIYSYAASKKHVKSDKIDL